MWAAIASFFLGAIAWIITKLLFEPGREIFELRRQTHEALLVYGNIGRDTSQEVRDEAGEVFRTTGASLVSRHVAGYPWLTYLCDKLLGWDIHSAGELLISLGNGVKFADVYIPSVSPTVELIRGALKLPPVQPSTVARALKEHTSAPAPLDTNDGNQF